MPLWSTTWNGTRLSVAKGTLSDTLRAFDVDFAHCTCMGTRHKSGILVIAVRWKRKPCGKTRFQCMRCKTTWSMDNVALEGKRLMLDQSHPQERARRFAIDPDFNHVLAVNIRTSHAYQAVGDL